MRGIRLHIDNPGARIADRVGDRRDDVDAPSLGKIRDALYKGCQTTPPTTVRTTRLTPT
jgi:hypothetical protein